MTREHQVMLTDAHCHVSGGDPSVREFIVGREFFGVHPWECLGGLEGLEGCGGAGRAALPTGDVTVGRVVGPSDPLGRVGLEGLKGLEGWLRGKLAAHPEAGVGEIGLDRLKSREISPLMREIFEIQLKVALELGRPVVLHGAKCWGQVVKTLQTLDRRVRGGSVSAASSQQPATSEREEGRGPTSSLQPPRSSLQPPRSSLFPPNCFLLSHPSHLSPPRSFLFHGFSRSDGLIPDIVALGGYISVGPAVLNDHAVNYRELVKKIPADRLLVETDRDCPVEELLNPLTGQPLTIRDVLEKTAEVRGMTADALATLTTDNASRFYRV